MGLLLYQPVTYAQHVSRLGRFEMDAVKGCAPFTVTLTNLMGTNCTPNKPCAMDYENNGQAQQNVLTYTYTTPGVYTLSVLYQAVGIDDIVITVYENIRPDFTIYSCSNLKVLIDITDKNYDEYRIDFDNGEPEIRKPNHDTMTVEGTYINPGEKAIRVRGVNAGAQDNCRSNIQSFTALSVLPPATLNALTTLDETNVQLDITTLRHIQYRLEYATDTPALFQRLDIPYSTPTTTVPDLNTAAHYYCFRLSSYDPCINTDMYSNTVCSQRFDLTISSELNTLNWVTSAVGIQKFDIERNDIPYTHIPATQSSFDDAQVTCKEKYCYTLISRYMDGSISTSKKLCGTSFNTVIPPPITDISTLVDEPGVLLNWTLDPTYTPSFYSVFRIQNRENFARIGTPLKPEFTDQEYTAERSYCYRITYTDQCDNISAESVTFCPVNIEGDIDKNNTVTLNWNDYSGWAKGVNRYVIEQYDHKGMLIQSFDNGQNTFFIDDRQDLVNQVVTYRIKAYANESSVAPSFSNALRFTKNIRLFFPTAFTPNDDRLNDSFNVLGQYITKTELSIFNRWGELIFYSETNQPWDGSYANKYAPDGVYVWSANITDMTGHVSNYSDTVILLRTKK